MAEPTPAEQTTPAKAEAPKPESKTFTQEELDRIVQDRLARAKKDAPSDDEIESLKASAARLAEIEEANRSELEKAAARAEKAEKDRDEALTLVDQTKGQLNAVHRKNAIFAAASEAGADAEIVHALLATSDFKVTSGENTFEVTLDDSGQVAGAKEAVSALIAQKNIAGTTTPPGPGDGGPRTPVPAQTIGEQIAAAEAAGDTDTAMSLKSQRLASLVTNGT